MTPLNRQGVRNLDVGRNGRRGCTHAMAPALIERWDSYDREYYTERVMRCVRCGATTERWR